MCPAAARPAAARPGGGEAGGGSQDPQQPPAGGTTAKKLVSVTVKPWNNGFKEFTDGAPDYGDKKAEIEKLQRKIAQVQELLDTSMTQLDLNKAIWRRLRRIKEQEVNLKWRAEAGQEAGGAGRRQRVRGVRRHGEGRAGPGRGL